MHASNSPAGLLHSETDCRDRGFARNALAGVSRQLCQGRSPYAGQSWSIACPGRRYQTHPPLLPAKVTDSSLWDRFDWIITYIYTDSFSVIWKGFDLPLKEIVRTVFNKDFFEEGLNLLLTYLKIHFCLLSSITHIIFLITSMHAIWVVTPSKGLLYQPVKIPV